MMDVTNPNTTDWLEERLGLLMQSLGQASPDELPQSEQGLVLPDVSLFLDTGEFGNIPHYFEFSGGRLQQQTESLGNPDVSRDLFLDAVADHFPVVGISGVSQRFVLLFGARLKKK